MATRTQDEIIADPLGVTTDLPAAIDVSDAELDLLEAHLSGLVSMMLNLPG